MVVSSTVKVDTQGRITLGHKAQGVSSYKIIEEGEGVLTLLPQVEVAMNELWLYKNQKALTSVEKGIEQSKAGKLKRLDKYTREPSE